jgi:putative aminopeptidase FrvX
MSAARIRAAEAAPRQLRLKPRRSTSLQRQSSGRAATSVAGLLAGALMVLGPVRLSAQTTVREAGETLAPLVEAYGPSGHEGPVREVVLRMLPAWATPQTDTAGNVWVRVGQGAPVVVFVAHMDEIGFEVTGIRPDGQLTLRTLGGFMTSLFEAEPAFVHTAGGVVPAVFTPRDSLGASPRRTVAITQGGRTEPLYRADPGTGSQAGTEALGIRVGDAITMPKRYVGLFGTRATGRSFDDRVGCAALILALRRLDPSRVRHGLLFVFSTREEVGLQGARAVANALGTEAGRVHALDTFVSSDAPLEVKTFADAPLGRGAVARSVDNSSVTPVALVDSLVALARERGIMLQVGTTNGGNDGSTFTRYGVPDVAYGWPLRYSHSPAEVIDLKDLVAMADLTLAIAERW